MGDFQTRLDHSANVRVCRPGAAIFDTFQNIQRIDKYVWLRDSLRPLPTQMPYLVHSTVFAWSISLSKMDYYMCAVKAKIPTRIITCTVGLLLIHMKVCRRHSVLRFVASNSLICCIWGRKKELLQYLREYFDIIRVKLIYFRNFHYKISTLLGYLYIVRIPFMHMNRVLCTHTSYYLFWYVYMYVQISFLWNRFSEIFLNT